ncbi:MAG TPA: hypothetical protein PKA66_14385 [Gemmatimonadales bacterium]|nr:hypothetical protein [Gemmatimonadales bacterium]
MTPHQAAFEHFGDAIAWLPPEQAFSTYNGAMPFSSNVGYGLDPTHVFRIERLEGADIVVMRSWLAARMRPASESVRIVFGRHDVCRLEVSFLLDNWQDMFIPSRDDALILSDSGAWVAFYCHEDWFEFGWRRPVSN